MNCLKCHGGCCESFSLPLASALPNDRSDEELQDINTWVILHADVIDDLLVFECRCKMLSPTDGTCRIYDERPDVCRRYEAGSPACLETVKRRRSPADYERIRGDGDPKEL